MATRSRSTRATRFGSALTLKGVQAQLRASGIVLTKSDGEYRVNFRGGSERTAYYTSDLADALATGESMARSTRR